MGLDTVNHHFIGIPPDSGLGFVPESYLMEVGMIFVLRGG